MFMDNTPVLLGESRREVCIWTAGTAHLPQDLFTVLRRGSTLHIWGAIYYGVKLLLY